MDSEKLNRFLFPALTSMLLLSEQRLSRRIIWNLSGFTIILFLWRQLIAASHSDSKIDSNSLSVHAKLAKVLSSAKLWTEAFGIKKKKWLKKKKKKIGPKIEPWVHLIWLCQTHFTVFTIYLNTLFTFFFK